MLGRVLSQGLCFLLFGRCNAGVLRGMNSPNEEDLCLVGYDFCYFCCIGHVK